MLAIALVLCTLLASAADAEPRVADYFAAQQRAFAAYEKRDAQAFLAGAKEMLAAHPDHPPAHYAYAAASAFFATLPYTARKEFATWVGDAKRANTRQRRVEESLRLLREGRRR